MQLVAFLEQYAGAPATIEWLRYNLKASTKRFGDHRIGHLSAQQTGTWRKSLPESRRHDAHRALRQVLQAGVRWKWIEENVAAYVKNPAPKPGEIDPFDSWEEVRAVAAELDETYGALVIFMAGTGVRPEEAFGRSGAMSTSRVRS